VAGNVSDDEPPSRRREIAVRDVDRDLLLALDLEPVGEQRQIDAGEPLRLACSTARSWSPRRRSRQRASN
jgi:hypothetical protein